MHKAYAHSLSEIGEPLHLPYSGGWLLARDVPGTSGRDATGSYPMFCCRDWDALPTDLNNLRDLISVALVADPFGGHSELLLRQSFPDLMIPFKEHFVTDLERAPRSYVCKHHQRNARLAARDLDVEHCSQPKAFGEEWISLYAHLVSRHDIRGAAKFSAHSLRRQLEVPGLEAFRAIHNGQTVGMLLWMANEDVAHYHLAAYSPTGYTLRASFALFWFAREYFFDRGFRWLNLGGYPGLRSGTESGLARFKRGWSTGTRTAYFCGRIYDREAYAGLLPQPTRESDGYFPGYRQVATRD